MKKRVLNDILNTLAQIKINVLLIKRHNKKHDPKDLKLAAYVDGIHQSINYAVTSLGVSQPRFNEIVKGKVKILFKLE
ncbi:unnamed protein product [marine sediment metagenome]|uniref:Uncharacterized protein n=1 Tax=marine sediment metagenome TaxID=412755 RepID=X1JNT4_9ZZZZ